KHSCVPARWSTSGRDVTGSVHHVLNGAQVRLSMGLGVSATDWRSAMRNDLAILLALVCIGVATLVFPACTNPNSEVSDAEASHTEAVTYATYTNERFNYRLEYPAHFVAEGEPTNNDGQVFSGENVELRVFGTHNVQDESLRTIAR